MGRRAERRKVERERESENAEMRGKARNRDICIVRHHMGERYRGDFWEKERRNQRCSQVTESWMSNYLPALTEKTSIQVNCASSLF